MPCHEQREQLWGFGVAAPAQRAGHSHNGDGARRAATEGGLQPRNRRATATPGSDPGPLGSPRRRARTQPGRSHRPVHTGKVPPEVPRPVCRRHFFGIDHDGVGLPERGEAGGHRGLCGVPGCPHTPGPQGTAAVPRARPGTHLEEARDVPFVAHPHGHHVLKEPEEGPVVALLGPGFVQEAVKLEEEAPGALWAGERERSRASAGGRRWWRGSGSSAGTRGHGDTHRTAPSWPG